MNEQRNMLDSGNNYRQPANLNNATASLVLGIISIVTGLCYISAIVGVVCGIIGLVLSNKDRSYYRSAPEMYSQSSYSQSNAGRTCSIIGLILSALWLLFILAMIIFVGRIGLDEAWRR
jgi:M penetrans paralogue family 26